MSREICAFCLGDSADIPVFGSSKDAKDFVSPCSSCTLVTHRKCLIDWFQSLLLSQMSHPGTADLNSSLDSELDLMDTTIDSSFLSFTNNPRMVAYVRLGSNMRYRQESAPHSHQNSAPCPQCKTPIIFEVGELSLVTFYEYFRDTLYDVAYYGGLSFGISGAGAGIIILGYRALAHCGLNITEAIKPLRLIIPELNRNKLAWSDVIMKPMLVLLGKTASVQSLSTSRYDYIPVLPLVMYRMRTLLVFDIIFNRKVSSVIDIFNEVQVFNYFSSLGSHVLVKQLWRNAQSVVLQWSSGKLSISSISLSSLVKGVNWWDPNVMVASIIPARWAYDLFYRLVVNRAFFNITASVEPRKIVNSLSSSEANKLEALTLQVTQVQADIELRVRKLVARRGFTNPVLQKFYSILRYVGDEQFFKILGIKLSLWLLRTKACLQHDYSHSLLNHLVIIAAVSTVAWPFIAADIGKVIYYVISKNPRFASVEAPRLEFFSNLVAMAVVAVLKDVGNLVLSHVKSQQLYTINIVKAGPRPARERQTNASPFPGAYVG